MKKMVLLLFVAYGLTALADSLPLLRLYNSGVLNGATGVKELESLLAKGFDPNEQESDGTSLLMSVAKGIPRGTVLRSLHGFNETNDLAIAKVLLAHGADPNVRTTFGETALGNVLQKPAFEGQLAFAKLLLDKGADPNAADHLGNTPLMQLFGAKFDEAKLELMKLLLERGADVKGGGGRKSVLDKVGDWQVGTQKLEVVRMLVKKGAPVTDMAILDAWRDEPLRRYLLGQSGKTEDDFEVWSSGATFSVRTKRKDGQGADSECLHWEMQMRERRMEQEERRHREWMARERSRRETIDRISADRRQRREAREERDLKTCQERVERRRGELLLQVPAGRRKAFESWLASRRKEEAAALESARKRAREREAEATSRDEKSAAHKADIADKKRRQDEDRVRHLREIGAPEYMIKGIEMDSRMNEMRRRHQAESEAINRSGRFDHDQNSALVHELSEYQCWLYGRVREDERRAGGSRLPIRSTPGLRQTGHADSVRRLEEASAKLQQIRDRQHRWSTTFVITFIAVVVFAIVLAAVSSFWRRGRRGVRGYGACQHESSVVVNYFRCLAKYVDFSGRADRSEYWSFALTNALIAFLIRRSGSLGLEIVFAAVMLMPWLAAATRRLHDVGRSGWRLIFFLVPLVVFTVFGNMPMRDVNELGLDEDWLTIVVAFSFCMVLVFGIWNLVLLLRKSVEDDPFDLDRHDYEIDENLNESVEMNAVSKDEIDMIETSEKREL